LLWANPDGAVRDALKKVDYVQDMSYDLPAFLQRIAAFLSHFTANPPGNDQILQPSPAISSRLDPSISRDSRANGSSSHGSMYLHSSSWMAQGWPDRGEAWSNSSGKTLAPNRFWQFLILLW
jgi:hypothetical protein